MGEQAAREVRLRSVEPSDRLWLLADGLHPRKIGEQYGWYETPLQLYIAPARAWRSVHQPASIVEVDGRRAGYIGPNPLSGNLEYFLQPWARGGSGVEMITTYLRDHRAGDRPRRFYVSHSNERSKRALLRAFERLGWSEGTQYRVDDGRAGWSIWITGR